MIDTTGRHPAVVDVARYFEFGHLPQHLQEVSARAYDLAEAMIDYLPDSPQLTNGLNKLLEAKDAFVRAALDRKQTNG